MARVNRLKALNVEREKKPGMYADGAGLYLQVTKGRKGVPAKSWIFRYMLDGNPRWMGLGPLHTITLAEARAKATECRRKLLDGIDPIQARKNERERARLENARSITFRKAAEGYIDAHKAAWNNAKHSAQWTATLKTYAYPAFGSFSVQAIDTTLVMKALEPIWTEKPETANRVRGRIEAVLDWAGARGYRTGENPARWRGHLDKLLPARGKVRAVKHHAALHYDRMHDFVVALRAEEGVAALALEFLILTACRTGEVLGARWEEIDDKKGVWTIPAERMKAGKEHRVPLSDEAKAVLTRARAVKQGDFVFPGHKGDGPLSNMAMLAVLKRMKRDEITVHGFRSTFRDWAGERTNHPTEVAEMALAHAVGDKVEAAYRRGDMFEKRKRLMADWAKFCDTPAPEHGKVVTFPATA